MHFQFVPPYFEFEKEYNLLYIAMFSPVSWQCFLPSFLKLQTQRCREQQHDIVSSSNVRAGAQASERKSVRCCVSDIVYMT